MWHSGNLEVGSLHFTYWNDEWTWIWFDPVRWVVLVHSPLWLRSAARILCYIPIGWCLTCPDQLGCPNSFVTFLLVDACIARHSQTARSSLHSYWSITLGLPSPVRLPEFFPAFLLVDAWRTLPSGCPNSSLHSYWSRTSGSPGPVKLPEFFAAFLLVDAFRVPGPVSPRKPQT